MSRMADMMIDIEEALSAGEPAESVARRLRVPMKWVLDTEERLTYGNEDDAFAIEAAEIAFRMDKEDRY